MTTKTDTTPGLQVLAEMLPRVGKQPAKKAALKAKAKPKAKGKGKAKKAGKVSKPRAESKQARFIVAMRTANGMSIGEAVKAFDWQPHTVRGAIAGAIKKRLGLKVDAEQDEKRGTVYRIKK